MRGQQDSYKRLNDFRETEKTISGLREAIRLEKSLCEKAALYNKLISLLLDYGDAGFFTANFSEFTDDFTSSVEFYPVQGRDPAESETFLLNAVQILNFFPGLNEGRLPQITDEKLLQLNKLRDTLQGDSAPSEKLRRALYFPVIEQKDNLHICSYLETLSVRIIRSDKPTSFLIYPGENATDPRLKKQVETAFHAALKLTQNGRKNNQHRYEVIVTFMNSRANYVGDSFGLLLTIQFYLELSRIYYPALNMRPEVIMCLTGGIDEYGKVTMIGSELINTKLEAAALSDSEYIIIPKEDHRKLGYPEYFSPDGYPQRKLNIIGITSPEEILNRRDLIMIEKKPLRRRIAEATQRNSRTFLVGVIIILMSVILLLFRSDQNPVSVSFEKNIARVENADGEVLWSKILVEPAVEMRLWGAEANQFFRILDLDGDGSNEVILAQIGNGKKEEGVVAYDHRGNRIWSYYLREQAESPSEGMLSANYKHWILDYYHSDTLSVLIIAANNLTSYSSAIFALDTRTGKRVGGAYWSSGHIFIGKVLIKNTGDPYLLLFGIDNGFGELIIFSSALNPVEGMRPSTGRYEFLNKEKLIPELMIRIPKTDVEILLGRKYPLYYKQGFRMLSEEQVIFTTSVYEEALLITLNPRTLELKTECVDAFAQYRDSLIISGRLDGPFTNTPEFLSSVRDSSKVYYEGEWLSYISFHNKKNGHGKE